ncbi:DUF1836 domain-containing protein [Streptococcus didelphis]|uniref:DUF1836 domain-containing protein n=1 Tax=Streptococcus didelphis TaxID=102886 RepID=A0ABY9LHE8_9STRE|nr:DUF1836 domain-containing protein [Streptococcus didelphis]WMB28267.1 DUF1836 domain-containing protein [Streptococcus didelphis]WMB28941.1 DUF1836 domain-containing protein [Streptococcus didelphis]
MINNQLPRWEQLPDIDLYLDQVLLYVNQNTLLTENTDQKNLTASMVNNYVKHAYMEKPIKKRYSKHQIARLIAIAVLKNTFPIQEISKVLNNLQKQLSSETLYNIFVSYWNDGQKADTPEIIINACKTVKYYQKTFDLINQYMEENNESNF